MFIVRTFHLYYVSVHLAKVGIAQSLQRLATSWTAGGLEFEPRHRQDFSPLHVIQIGSGAHPASYPTGTGTFNPGGNANGA
jgi:hypothetical protein